MADPRTSFEAGCARAPGRYDHFLFTDIEGSTRLHELGEDAYAGVLVEHHRLVREAFEATCGVEVDNQGDGFLFVCERASDAVSAADRAQELLAPEPVDVRMGLHTGKPQSTADGYVELDVDKGSRIGAVAHGGQVVLTRATREVVEAEVLDLGEHRFAFGSLALDEVSRAAMRTRA